MILNPTHEITLSGLPSEVLDAYVRYKKGSRAIVAWLVQYGSNRHKGVKTLPLKELAELARTVSSQIKQVPDVIHFHFRETIAARKHLSRFFRQNIDKSEQEVNTVNHEHFTNSLTDIYSDICAQCRATQAAHAALKRQQKAKSNLKDYGNHFDHLHVEDPQYDDKQYSLTTTITTATSACMQCNTSGQKICHSSEPDISLEDDEMSLTIEYAILAEQAYHIFDATTNCWVQVGKNNLSFVATAAVTNVALSLLRDLCIKLQQLHPNISASILYSKCNFRTELQACQNLLGYQGGLLSFLRQLEDTGKTIELHPGRQRPMAVESTISFIQNLSDIISSAGSDACLRALQLALLDNVENLCSTTHCQSTIMHSSMPIVADMKFLWSHPRKEHDLQSTFSLYLMSASYHQYMHESQNLSAISLCRIKALQLASTAAASVRLALSDKISFPCQCPQTLAYHLSSLQYDLESYAKHRCWDLYSQSPWVAGNHIIEMLDMLSYYGMRLCHYRHFIAAVLHSYNVLCELANLDKIAIMEELCGTFRQIFFSGGNRPVSSFRNSWSRFVGARLKFKKGHQAANHRESWCMAIPAHAAKVAAGLGSGKREVSKDTKFDFGSISQIFKLKQQSYHVDEIGPMNQVNGAQFQSSSLSKSKRKKRTSNPKPSEHFLLELQTKLDAEFQTKSNLAHSDLPCARINLIAIFTSCVSIVNKISKAIHTSPEDKNTHNCICFVTTLLAAADRITEGRKLGKLECWKREERELAEVCKKAIKDITDEVEKNSKLWLWDV